MSQSDVPPALRKLWLEEATDASVLGIPECEVKWSRAACSGVAHHLHHRDRRRDPEGGKKRSNIVLCCAGCHQAIHDHPEESYLAGWLVPM